MEITFLIPTRNGAEFLEWSYNSIRKNQGIHDVEIFVLNDNSDKDNTSAVLSRLQSTDKKLKIFNNTSGERLGISGGYYFLANQVKTKYLMHFHNDMYLCEGALDSIEEEFRKHGDKIAVSLTRIEHSMGYHSGPEKIIWDNAPIEFDEWDEELFLSELPKIKNIWENKTTEGHFAPFCMNSEVYHSLGGIDNITFPLQSREDSDWAFRLVLSGIKTIQIPQFVFHFASRGNRRNKYETNTLIDNPEWVKHNYKATRNFIRKWGTLNLHDEYLKPNTPVFYNVGYKIVGNLLDIQYLRFIEPFCSNVWVEDNPINRNIVDSYIWEEQPNTMFNLTNRILLFNEIFNQNKENDIIIEINLNKFSKFEYDLIARTQDIANQVKLMNEVTTFRLNTLLISTHSEKINNWAHYLINRNSQYLSNKFIINS